MIHTCALNCSASEESHAYSATCFLVESLGLFSLNVTFVYVLWACRKHLNWKIYIFVLNLTISDIFSGVALFAFSTSSYFYICSITWFIDDAIQLVYSYSLLITTLNSNSFFFAQYLAIRHPVYYQTKVTRNFILKIIGGQYAIIIFYEVCKGFILCTVYEIIFSYIEVAIMAGSLVTNIGTYSYVLHVAFNSQQMKLKKPHNSVQSAHGGARQMSIFVAPDDGGRVKYMKEYLKYVWSVLTVDYYGISVAGLQLLTYLVTFIPMFAIRIQVIAFGSGDGQRDIYLCQTTTCHAAMMLWFARGLADPMIQMIRDKKLRIFNRRAFDPNDSVISSKTLNTTVSLNEKSNFDITKSIPTISEKLEKTENKIRVEFD